MFSQQWECASAATPSHSKHTSSSTQAIPVHKCSVVECTFMLSQPAKEARCSTMRTMLTLSGIARWSSLSAKSSVV